MTSLDQLYKPWEWMRMTCLNDQLVLKKLNKIYPNHFHALKDIDLTIKKGEFVILLGLSGSGKSTLLRCINRIIDPTSGEICFNNQNVMALEKKDLRQFRRSIGMIFQEFNLIPSLSVKTNVLTGRLGYLSTWQSLRIKYRSDLSEQAKSNLKRVSLEKFESQKVKTLSGGQKQRVAIARALMQEPLMLLADEPVASLDPATADSVMKYLGTLNQQDEITVICSLHFLSLARKYGSRVVALKDGRIVFDGKPEEITPERFKKIYGEDAEEIDIH